MLFLSQIVLGSLVATTTGAVPSSSPGDTTAIGLPVVEVPGPSGAGSTLAVILSGDGGWAPGDKAMAAIFARRGVATVGLDIPSYLRVQRSPDTVGVDLARLLRHYLEAWHKDRVILVGYSHGADLVPFMASRLPADLRARVDLIAMLGLEYRASFLFHWTDVVADVQHDDGLPVLPEVEKLQGLRLLCVMGEGERHSLCGALPAALARVERRPGGHRITGGEGGAVAELVLAADSSLTSPPHP